MTISMCDELGRATRCYVSAFQRDRVHGSQLVRGDVRCLVADFNGAIPKGRTITSVKWMCETTQVVVMANATISGRQTKVDITAQLGGCALLKCEAVMDNGEVYGQLFRIEVRSRWNWFADQQPIVTGPTELVASAVVVTQ